MVNFFLRVIDDGPVLEATFPQRLMVGDILRVSESMNLRIKSIEISVLEGKRNIAWCEVVTGNELLAARAGKQ